MPRPYPTRHKYTPEQVQFIQDNHRGIPIAELTRRLNETFNTDLDVQRMKAYVKNHSLRNGLDARFVKGRAGFRHPKGTHFAPQSEFKKGCIAHNHLPVGTERVNGEGYTDIKIAEPKKWKTKHSILWEEVNGPVPKGHKLIFKDGDRSHVALENIALVSDSEMAILNKNALIKSDPDLTDTGILVARLISKVSTCKKSHVKSGRSSKEE